jgi:hypothetical protein
MNAPFPNKKDWKETLSNLGDSYKNYQNLLKDEEVYICSSGIASKILKSEKNFFIFSEQDEATREKLKSQIQFKNFHLMENSRNLAKVMKEEPEMKEKTFNSIFGLIDPFQLTLEEWNGVVDDWNEHFSSIQRGILLCFNKTKGEMNWKEDYRAPKNFKFIGSISQNSFTLACYSTNNLEVETKFILKSFNWDVELTE